MSPLPEMSADCPMDAHHDASQTMNRAQPAFPSSAPAPAATGADEVEWFVQMQFDMLRKESAELSSKLDTMTAHLRDTAPGIVEKFEPSNQSTSSNMVPSATSIYSHPERVGKAPRMKQIQLVFEGQLSDCDKAAVSSKLLHLKRILHRRLEAGLSPTAEATSSVLQALLMLHGMSARAEKERIRVLTCWDLTAEQQAALRRDILSLVSFTQSLDLCDEAVTFAKVAATSGPISSLVLIVGFNTGEEDLKEATLHELSEPDAVAWASVCGDKPGVKLAWACKDLTQNDQAEGLTVCSSLDSHKAVTFFFAPHLQQFFADRAVGEAAQMTFVRDVLADHIDSFSYLEWESGASYAHADPSGSGEDSVAGRGGIVVQALMPEWVATTLWELAQRGDAWLSLMTTGPHRLASVSVGNFQCDMAPRATAKTSIKTLLFELERQQELIRRKLASLERLMKCKQFVAHMEAFTLRLQSHAEELFSGIRIKQETPNTLDALCSQLSSLSVQCGLCIDQALTAVEAVGVAPLGEEVVLEQQLSKILQAQETKQHVDRLKDQVEGALAQKQRRATPSPSSASPSKPSVFPPHMALGAGGGGGGVAAAAVGRARVEGEMEGGAGQSGGVMEVEEGGERRMVLEMLEQLEKGIQVQKEQQEKLVEYWLGQHEKMKSELSSLLSMANAAADVESIGVEELQGRFQQYIDFLEEHEQVEDTMLFPLVKTLFPASAQAVDSVLDPQRHKGVDALHARVGRQLQQLHDRHRAGEEMVQDSDEMRNVVESLERLNDYMVGHIRYEEEVAMPWLGAARPDNSQPLATT